MCVCVCVYVNRFLRTLVFGFFWNYRGEEEEGCKSRPISVSSFMRVWIRGWYAGWNGTRNSDVWVFNGGSVMGCWVGSLLFR